MTDTTITLIGERFEQDADGIPRARPTRRSVFASSGSVSQTEYFSGGRNGLNPEVKFNVFAGDYRGERRIEWNGDAYAVYRTYAAGDYIELYAERANR